MHTRIMDWKDRVVYRLFGTQMSHHCGQKTILPILTVTKKAKTCLEQMKFVKSEDHRGLLISFVTSRLKIKLFKHLNCAMFKLMVRTKYSWLSWFETKDYCLCIGRNLGSFVAANVTNQEWNFLINKFDFSRVFFSFLNPGFLLDPEPSVSTF